MNVLAHSFGSLVVAEYARRYPDLLARVIFLGSTGPRRSAAARLVRGQFADADSALLRSMYEPLAELLSGTADDPVSACQTYHERGAELAESLGRRGPTPRGSERLMEPDALRYYFRYTAQVGPRLFGDWDYTVGLESFPGALLVIYGADDADGLAVQGEWVTAVHDARLLAVPGAGKAVHVERPDAVFSAIDEFLDGRWPEGALPGRDATP